MSIKNKELVVLTEDFRGYPKGTVGYFAGYSTDCGHEVANVALKDESFESYLEKHHEFDCFDSYIDYQNKENIFGDKYWTNPFTCIQPYVQNVMSISQINAEKEKLQKEIEHSKNRLDSLQSLSSFLS